jgi:tetratricopeptide (TPR) repeat protein
VLPRVIAQAKSLVALRAVALLLAATCLPTAADAQSLAHYEALAREHAEGASDDELWKAMERAGTGIFGFDRWTPGRIRAVASETAHLVRTTRGVQGLTTARRAMLLHLDRARLERLRGTPQAEQLHLDAGSTLASALPERHAAFGSRWFLAAALLWQTGEDWSVSQQLIDRGLAQSPRDVALLLAKASIDETLATFGAAGPGQGAVTTRERVRPRGGREAHRKLLDSAYASLRKAVEADPAHPEVRLRLARITMLHLGRDEAAVRELEALLAANPPAGIAYLAHLTLGELREKDGRFEDAAAAYRAAVASRPDAPTARIALSHALHRLRRTSDAAEAVHVALKLAEAENVGDPWWEYPMGQRARASALLAELRAEVR